MQAQEHYTLPSNETEPSPMALAAMRFLLELRKRGVTDHMILSAFERTERSLFLPRLYSLFAYEDRILPIAAGQIAESPFSLASIINTLQIDAQHKVLEIGAGSGYATALLARLSRRVYALERSHSLLHWAENRLASLELVNASLIHADGSAGYDSQAPYDRIFVSAALEEVPSTLTDQLAEGGRCILPIGKRGTKPMLWLISRKMGQISELPLIPLYTTPIQSGLMMCL